VPTLSESDVRKLLNPKKLVAIIEAAFKRGPKSFAMPARLQLETAHGVELLMPCFDPVAPAMGFKSVFVLKNPAPRQQRVQATYFLLNAKTGSITATIAANYLTDLRTAATSAVATMRMARKNAGTLAIFGAGRQARAHLELFAQLFRFDKILVCASTPDQSRKFAKDMSKSVPRSIEAAAPAQCAEGDIICACTSSTSPLFDGRKLRPGTHLNLVGAFRPSDREVDSETVSRARVIVDTYDALAEAGDLIIPLREQAISRSHIAGDLHEVVTGKADVRRSLDDITLFKSVGCAIEDLAAASLAVAAASKNQSKSRKQGRHGP
jgi:ornithine cyclodeaminase/alanine dehydrogenase-like protein (mu-crystallin family)